MCKLFSGPSLWQEKAEASGHGFVAGSKLSWADVAVFADLCRLISGFLDGERLSTAALPPPRAGTQGHARVPRACTCASVSRKAFGLGQKAEVRMSDM